MRVMIVDDERFVRAGIIQNINWKSHNIEEVLEAKDGLDALRILGSEGLDILITDIKMPKLDGISLALKALVHNPEMKIIFISAYSDKEYLMSAIKLNVVAYVEKPIVLDELNKAVLKAVSSIKVVQRSAAEDRMRVLLRELILSSGQDDVVKINNNSYNNNSFSVGIIQYRALQEIVPQNISRNLVPLFIEAGMRVWIFGEILKNDYVIVIESVKLDNEKLVSCLNHFIDTIREREVFVSISDIGDGLNSISTSFQQALNGMRLLFFKGFGSLIQARNDQTIARSFKLSKELFDRFRGALINRIYDQYQEAIRDLLLVVENGAYAELDVRRAFFNILELISSLCSEQELIPGWNNVVECATLKEIIFLVNSAAYKLFRMGSVKNKTVSLALGIITSEYYNQSLSISYICEKLNVSKSKLCRLFRLETGMTINRYIAGYRIRIAQDMIINENILIGEVALSVGFNNLNYFSKTFKRQTGLLPSQYRDKIK